MVKIEIDSPTSELIQQRVQSGEYRSAAEYIGSLVRQDQPIKATPELEALLLEGLRSGTNYEANEAFWAGIHAEVEEKLNRHTQSASDDRTSV